MKQFDKKVIASLLHDWEVNNIDLPEGYEYPDFATANIDVLDSNDEAMLLKIWKSCDDYGYSTSVVVLNGMEDLFAVDDWMAPVYAESFDEVRRYRWLHQTGKEGIVIRNIPRLFV